MQRRVSAVLAFVVVALVGPVASATDATPTPTPTPPLTSCASIPCSGDCAVLPPCTPGMACPQFAIHGTCAVVDDVCTCVTNSLTPPPTPTFGGCRLTCDGRPCLGPCADGTLAPGSCTLLTVDRGCACVPDCGTPTPAPTIAPPCSNVPCGGSCGICPPCVAYGCKVACQVGTCEIDASGACSCALFTPPLPSTPTATPAPPSGCVGDCTGMHTVTVAQLITLVDIALGTLDPSACAQGIPPGAQVTVVLIVQAVNDLLIGCPGAPTATPTVTCPLPPCAFPLIGQCIVTGASCSCSCVSPTPSPVLCPPVHCAVGYVAQCPADGCCSCVTPTPA